MAPYYFKQNHSIVVEFIYSQGEVIRKQKAGANFNQTLEKPLEHLRMQAVNTPHSTESNILISQRRRK